MCDPTTLFQNCIISEGSKTISQFIPRFIKFQNCIISEGSKTFRGGTEWETMEEWFEDVEYQFEEVA